MAALLKRNDLFNVQSFKRFMKNGLDQSGAGNANCNTITVRHYRFPTYELTLMAHGETDDDISKKFGGWMDTSLSSFGVEQAQRAGKILAMDGAQYHVAYTSELSRAQETVRHVLEPLAGQTKVFATWRLNDRHMGDLTGYNRSQMALVHGERMLKEWMEDYTAMPPIIKLENPKYRKIMEIMHKKHLTAEQIPRTESLQMVYNRVLPYWENIIVPSLKMRNRIIVVAHNTSLIALIHRFAELNEMDALHVNLPPAIPFTFTLDNHMRVIKPKPAKTTRKPFDGPVPETPPPEQSAIGQQQLRRLSDDSKSRR